MKDQITFNLSIALKTNSLSFQEDAEKAITLIPADFQRTHRVD